MKGSFKGARKINAGKSESEEIPRKSRKADVNTKQHLGLCIVEANRHLHPTASRAILTSQDSRAGDVHNETVLTASKKPGMSTVHFKNI